jgi:C4-dicarboxylate transporter, DctM subunit
MSGLTLAFIGFGAMLLLIAVRMPIGLSMLVVGALGFVHLSSWGAFFAYMKTNTYHQFANYTLSVIPLFILMGALAERSGLSQALFRAAEAFAGRLRGGLAMAVIWACTAFGAICGSSVATTATFGRAALPELQRYKYDGGFATGTIAVGGTLGILIPPSVILVVYAITTEQNIAKLFKAALIPGLIAALFYCIAIALVVRRWPHLAPPAQVHVGNRLKALAAVWPVLLIALTVVGGIYGGIFTPTEAAGIACIYAILVARFIYNEMSWTELWQTAVDSAKVISQILIIVSAAGAYSWLITTSGFPTKLVGTIAGLQLDTWLLLLIINIVLLFVGTVLEPPAAILILTPLLMPLIVQAGVDEIHFGIIFTVNLAVGMFIPPFGLNLFATHALFGIPLSKLYRDILPFIAVYLIALGLITYVPAITLAPLQLWR